MNNTVIDAERIEAQQLTLLSVPTAPATGALKASTAHARFQLSTATRVRGLAHVAEIRARLAAAHDDKNSSGTTRRPSRAA